MTTVSITLYSSVNVSYHSSGMRKDRLSFGCAGRQTMPIPPPRLSMDDLVPTRRKSCLSDVCAISLAQLTAEIVFYKLEPPGTFHGRLIGNTPLIQPRSNTNPRSLACSWRSALSMSLHSIWLDQRHPSVSSVARSISTLFLPPLDFIVDHTISGKDTDASRIIRCFGF